LLSNPIIVTSALPFALGVALGLIGALLARRWADLAAVAWGVALIFLCWRVVGPPVFPPVSSVQKLVYLALLGVIAGASVQLLPRAGAAASAAVAIVVASLWLGWRRFAQGQFDPQLLVAVIVAALIAIGVSAIVGQRPRPETPERPYLAPGAVLGAAAAGAIASVLGASILAGQWLGSIAALVGGYCLLGYVGMLTGLQPTFGWSKAVEFFVAYAAACALIQTALLAPKANPVALLLTPLPFIVAPLIAHSLAPVLPRARLLRPLAAGLLIAAPAIASVLTAIIWAPAGAALGFS